MNNTKYDFYAFISYKREDEKWAKWLQNKLEYYKIPTTVKKENPTVPDKIRPVFKDTTDLEPGILAEKISTALDSSRFLIVVCSPRSANSIWVGKEVQHFINNGRSEFIIPFIIGGTPNADNPEEECFPEGLRKLSGEKEILGVNINEAGREAAVIKTIARMFNLRFDTLWQRHERNRKRKLVGAMLLALLAIVTAAGTGFLYLDRKKAYSSLQKNQYDLECAYKNLSMSRDSIKKSEEHLVQINDSLQKSYRDLDLAMANLNITNRNLDITNRKLDTTNKNLEQSNHNLKIEKAKVIEALNNVRYEQIQYQAQNIENEIKEGNILKGILKVLEILPAENKDIPFVPKAMNVLLSGMNQIKPESFNMIAKLPNDSVVSPDGRWCGYADQGEYFLLDLFSMQSHKLPGEDITDKCNLFFSNDGKMFFGAGRNYCYQWDVQTKKMVDKVDNPIDYYSFDPFDLNYSADIFPVEYLPKVEKYTYFHTSGNKTWKGSNFSFTENFRDGERSLSFLKNNEVQKTLPLTENKQINRDFGYSPEYPLLALRESPSVIGVVDLVNWELQSILLPEGTIYSSYDRMLLLNSGKEIIFNGLLFSKRNIANFNMTPQYVYSDEVSMQLDFFSPYNINSANNNQRVYYNDTEWDLLSSNGNLRLYKTVITDFSKPVTSSPLLFETPHNKNVFSPFINFALIDDIPELGDAYILSEDEILFVSTQSGYHFKYNIKTGEKQLFAEDYSINPESYDHELDCVLSSSLSADGSILTTVTGQGAISVFDVKTGYLIMSTSIEIPERLKEIEEEFNIPIEFIPYHISSDGKYLYGKCSCGDIGEYYLRYRIPTPFEFIEYATKEIRNFWNNPIK